MFDKNNVSFFDDYAHHPTEITSVLDGVKVYKKGDCLYFSPHRISRLKNLKLEFAKSFKKANTIILCPLYKAGETIKLGLHINIVKLIAKNT